jgi:hypothetical protein
MGYIFFSGLVRTKPVEEIKTAKGNVGTFKNISTSEARKRLSGYMLLSNNMGRYCFGKQPFGYFNPIATFPAGLRFQYNRKLGVVRFLANPVQDYKVE